MSLLKNIESILYLENIKKKLFLIDLEQFSA